MMFFADRMLGKLAKKLRLLGFDTLYLSQIEEDEILKLCFETGRILITRNRELHMKALKQGIRSLLLKSDSWRQQLVELSKVLDLKNADRMTRCSLCNAELILANPEKVKQKVPLYVQQIRNEFYECPVCGRLYWEGTHVEHALEEFRRLNL
ncbi:Mut7-C RNAse domain-containing protein [Pseudothermotoga thermarum]|uniref:Mut7-C RNAse domain-containing protein n=1 Tax=Pseudothermotoga thermarum DSM 5069 TaxID=688269 RepID=F7YVP8_9THEM|nr:Mut7-C RNAse domain-containing protein [Pseudothermotoga thermarum]AEH51713.1 protein of unknown function DUF82 [Pseudothermotoga thermarum DSM 5069]